MHLTRSGGKCDLASGHTSGARIGAVVYRCAFSVGFRSRVPSKLRLGPVSIP